jgi:AcrR family transcriptional regulator
MWLMDGVDGSGGLPGLLPGPISAGSPPERGDAARNRRRLLDATRTLLAQRSPDDITTDDIATAAGLGKGTLFRRFGSRAGLMIELLDEDERAMQQAFMFGPPPLGPQAAPRERLLAFGRARLRFVDCHRAVLAQVNRDPEARYNPVFAVLHTHVRALLEAAGTTGDLDVQADGLLALLDADYVGFQLGSRGQTLRSLTAAWESLATKLCGR